MTRSSAQQPAASATEASAGAARATFLARVRTAIGRTIAASIPAPPTVNESLIRLCSRCDDVVRRFADEAATTGMQLHPTSEADLANCLAKLLSDLPCRSAATSVVDRALSSVVTEAAAGANCRVVDWHQTPGVAAHFEADAGITDVDAALAETGTLIISSGPTRSRACFLVPPIHIAVVRAIDILPDMIDYWSRGREALRDASAVTLITGPSKTADIEGILVTGVHGPREVHVVLVDGNRR